MATLGAINLNAKENEANFANMKIWDKGEGKKIKKIYIINGAKEFWGSKGELSKLMCETAKDMLESMGKSVDMIKIDDGFDPKAE